MSEKEKIIDSLSAIQAEIGFTQIKLMYSAMHSGLEAYRQMLDCKAKQRSYAMSEKLEPCKKCGCLPCKHKMSLGCKATAKQKNSRRKKDLNNPFKYR